ncbi:MAG: hypothetical protein HC927_13380 [Deltaproteobacteria bacterium]|nr:hypothetical protein [Deltaproteobacteria bacterium]
MTRQHIHRLTLPTLLAALAIAGCNDDTTPSDDEVGDTGTETGDGDGDGDGDTTTTDDETTDDETTE